MALPSVSTIDVPLTPVNDQGVSSSTPAGELVRADNAVVVKFNNDGALRVEKREGFVRETMDVRSALTGAQIVSTGFQAGPKLLTSLGEQIVIGADSAPHALAENGDSWTKFDYVYSPTIAKTSVVYGGNIQIANPDVANINGVRFYTWSEPVATLPLVPKIMAMVVDADGTPLRTPWTLVTGDPYARAKVVSNGAQFWVVYSIFTAVVCEVYNTDGVMTATLQFEALDSKYRPWDLTFQGGAVLYCQSVNDTARLTKLTVSGATVTANTTNLSFGVLANHGVFWSENATNDGFAYLLTSHRDPDGGTVEYANQIGTISTTPTVTARYGLAGTDHIYDQNGEGGVDGVLCEMTGVKLADALYVQLSFQDATDHRFDRTVFLHCIPNTVTVDGLLRSTRMASRPFVLPGDDRWQVLMYYPSVLFSEYAATGTNPYPTVTSGQPTYFMTDILTRQTTGRFCDGVAGQEWSRLGYPGDTGHGPYFFCLPHTFLDADLRLHVPVGYNAEVVNHRETTAISGQDILQSITKTRQVSAVNILDIRLGGDGQAVEYNAELFMPGALTTAFTGYSFSEQGISLAPEQPSLARSVGAGQLTPGFPYEYVLVFEWTNPQGRRVRSATSVPQWISLDGGAFNTITLTIMVNHLTNHPDLTISVYRKIIENGVQSSQYYKVSDDLDPLYNNRTLRTVTFVDTMSDSEASANEVLYTSLGFIDRDPAPAMSAGIVADNRVLVIGPDNALWFSGEANDTDPIWFSLLQRVFMPTNDELVRVEAMDGRIYLLCRNSIWYMPGNRWPAANGTGGSLEAPTKLGFTNGCTGQSRLVKEGIVYSSSAGGLWLIQRGMENIQLGAAAMDDFDGKTISSIAVDADQRIAFALAGTTRVQMVWDQVAKVWTKWINATDILLNHVVRGKMCYADATSLRVQTEDVYYDSDTNGTPSWYTMTLEAWFSLINIKGLKRVWEFLLTGERKSQSAITVDATYVTEDLDVTESWTLTPTINERFEEHFAPKVEEMSQMKLRITDAASLVAADNNGNSIAWELTSFTVGTEGGLVRNVTHRRSST